MIRQRQSLPLSMFGAIFLPEIVSLENDTAEVRLVNQCDSKLPTRDVTRLGDVLKAGVPLDKVPHSVLGVQSVTLALDEKQQSNNEGDK